MNMEKEEEQRSHNTWIGYGIQENVWNKNIFILQLQTHRRNADCRVQTNHEKLCYIHHWAQKHEI